MASTTYSALYNSDGTPLSTYPQLMPTSFSLTYTVPTAQQDLGDTSYLIPVPLGCTLTGLMVSNGDMDTNGTPLLDMDVVLRLPLSDGTNQDDILYNAGTAFTAAVTTPLYVAIVDATGQTYGGLKVASRSTTGLRPLTPHGHVILLVNAAAATAAAAAITLTIFCHY